jgi:2-dehydro-3-deoxygluconokinase
MNVPCDSDGKSRATQAMTRIACIGECMIELIEGGATAPGAMRRGYGGDTLNSAVYMARELPSADARVSYVTLLGDDPYSGEMLRGWAAEGIETDFVERIPGTLPGLYVIRVDEHGERDFLYWRDQAIARQLFVVGNATATLEALRSFDWIYFSGITLAILSEAGRGRLFDLCADIRRRGGRVAFDSNYRTRLWPDPNEARRVIGGAWQHTDVALPSYEDEALLFGDADPAATVARLRDSGCREVVVKRGKAACLVAADGDTLEGATEDVADVRDTTAAGDSFNAAYIAARIRGDTPGDAARAGHRLAARVIAHPGAIVPRPEARGTDS